MSAPAGSSLNLQPEEKLAILKKLCRGFGEPLQVRQDTGGRFWHLTTPATQFVVRRHETEGRIEPIRGLGTGPAEAIEDAWLQFITADVILSLKGMVPRQFRWDGVRFREA